MPLEQQGPLCSLAHALAPAARHTGRGAYNLVSLFCPQVICSFLACKMVLLIDTCGLSCNNLQLARVAPNRMLLQANTVLQPVIACS